MGRELGEAGGEHFEEEAEARETGADKADVGFDNGPDGEADPSPWTEVVRM